MSVKKKLFGKLPDGQEVFSYSLKNKNGAKVKICEYGATVISIKVPDRNGSFDDVVCGYSDLNSYINADGYLAIKKVLSSMTNLSASLSL
jgi:aldose 1-epimerase